MIRLKVQPAVAPVKWQQFIKANEPRSIALDGYVATGPRFKKTGPYANFNHHEDVSRLETRATCAQVLIAVRQGLYQAFQDDKGNPDATIFVNDCDEDVSLSTFILQNSHLAIGTMNPLLNKLVFMEDMLDTTAGAYPFPKDMETLQQLMWVFAPYHRFRLNGGLDSRDPVLFEDVIEDVGRRIMDYITGKAKTIQLDTRFETIGGGTGWTMVSEKGQNARVGVYYAGILAFVSMRERKDGRWNYILGRSSQFVPFPIPTLLKAFNNAEGVSEGDVWGGSDIIAGSPRISGSKLDPDRVTEVIQKYL